MTSLVPVAHFYERSEALCIQASLRSAGIPCHLVGEHISNAKWSLIFAIGGIGLMVPEAAYETATAIIQSAEKNTDLEMAAHAFKRRRFINISIFILLMFLGGNFVPVWLANRKYHPDIDSSTPSCANP